MNQRTKSIVIKYCFGTPLVCAALLFLSSCSSIYLADLANSPVPPRVAIKMEISDINQKKLADSLLLALAREFQVYSSEYRKFTLAPSLDSADLVVRVQVLHFHIIGSDTQTIIEEKRKKGEMPQNYDSLEQERMGRIVAANIAANVIANLISMPLGFATVIVIKDRGMLGTDLNAYSASTLSCEFELLAKNKIIWEKRTDHFFHLTNPTNEAEQISVLMRNTMLEIQDELPILSWRGNAFYQ